MNKDFDVIIVGAGIGGLICGAELAKKGLRVAVVEQHYLAGGACTTFRRGKFQVDAGVEMVSGLGKKGPVRLILRNLGLEHRLQWKYVPVRFELHDRIIDVPRDYREFQNMLAGFFPEEKGQIETFFKFMKQAYDEMQDSFITDQGEIYISSTPNELMVYPRKYPNFFRCLNKTWGNLLDSFFTNPALKDTVSVFSVYLGDDELNTSAVGMVSLFGLFIDGGYYPIGGIQALPNALVDLIRNHDGSILLRHQVEQIIVENGTVRGIRLANGRVMTSSIVISNADPIVTYEKLIGFEHVTPQYRNYITKLQPSTSAFMMYLGVNKKIPITQRTFCVRPFHVPEFNIPLRGIGFGRPSHLDPNLAPADGDVITMIALTPATMHYHNMEKTQYRAFKEALKETFLSVLDKDFPEVRKHIVFCETGTPKTFTRYMKSTAGAIYSTKTNQTKGQSWTKFYQSPLHGLYLTGAGTFPGPGVEAVMISGEITANAVLHQFQYAR